jgi:hypothetical protein
VVEHQIKTRICPACAGLCSLPILYHGLWDPFIGESLQIVLIHLSVPSLGHEICFKLLILLCEVVCLQIGHEEVSHQDTSNTTNGSDDERL